MTSVAILHKPLQQAHQQRKPAKRAFSGLAGSPLCSLCGLEMYPMPVPGAAYFPRRLECPTHQYTYAHEKPRGLWIKPAPDKPPLQPALQPPTHVERKVRRRIAITAKKNDLPLLGYMLRLVLFGAGKTIVYRNRVCEVVETHEHIRQLLPIGESESKLFWAPRRISDKQRFRKDRNERLLRSCTKDMYGWPPHWSGDPRPADARKSVLVTRSGAPFSRFPTIKQMVELVTKSRRWRFAGIFFGYPAQAALSALIRGHAPLANLYDRRKVVSRTYSKDDLYEDPGIADDIGNPKFSPERPFKHVGGCAATHPEHVYVLASPIRRTEEGGGFTREMVLREISGMRTLDYKMRKGVEEVVWRRQSLHDVASRLKLRYGALKRAASRVRSRIQKRLQAEQEVCRDVGQEQAA